MSDVLSLFSGALVQASCQMQYAVSEMNHRFTVTITGLQSQQTATCDVTFSSVLVQASCQMQYSALEYC